MYKEFRMLKRIALAATVVATATPAMLAAATAARAADVPYEAPPAVIPEDPIVAPFTWTGFYVGGNIGAGFGNSDTRYRGGSADIYQSGVVGGVYGGFNYQFHPNVVIGAEADFTFTDLDGDGAIPGAGARVKQQANWLSTVRARAGYAYDRFLAYGTGGVAFADLETSAPGGSESNTRTGWTVGGGLEAAITDNIVGRVEYQYVDFGSDSSRIGGRSVSSDFNASIVRAGIAYKF